MDEREQRDFESRLNAPVDRARPSQGVEQLWGMMGCPSVAPGAIPVAPGAGPPARPRTATKVGGD